MPARSLLGVAVLAAVLTACGAAGKPAPVASPPPPPLLSRASFAQVVAATVARDTDLGAELVRGSEITVHAGLNWVKVDLASAYSEYRREPARREVIAAGAATAAEERLSQGFGDAGFDAVRGDLRPLLKPLFRLRREPQEPVERRLQKGLVVVYAVDRTEDFTLVTSGDLARWGKSASELYRIAIANLARTTEALLCEQQLCGWASGDGYDATRLLVPKLRREIVRRIGPAVYAVPQDEVFVALPVRLADRIRAKVLEEFTTGKDGVSPDLFVEEHGKLVVLAGP